MRAVLMKLWTTSVLGLLLLIPASYFMLTLCMHIFLGSTTLYYRVAPSFIESGSVFLPLNKTSWILYGPLVAMLLNLVAILKVTFYKKTMQLQINGFRAKSSLNSAIAIQSLLLFVALLAYLMIQRYRY